MQTRTFPDGLAHCTSVNVGDRVAHYLDVDSTTFPDPDIGCTVVEVRGELCRVKPDMFADADPFFASITEYVPISW